MSRHSEFTANNELAADRGQRHALAANDARARETLRRATITKNDKRRAAESKRRKLAAFALAVSFFAVAAHAVAGALLGA